jgi:hypothetical protein
MGFRELHGSSDAGQMGLRKTPEVSALKEKQNNIYLWRNHHRCPGPLATF